jgi:predicted Fe-Mo cluster-binding NifX family protein
MVIAIPIFNDEIAPCFEAATRFLIAHAEHAEGVTKRIAECTGVGGFARARLLRDEGVSILICDGIKGFYRDLLQASGLAVVDGNSLSVEEALASYLTGKIKPSGRMPEIYNLAGNMPLDDLISWTRHLFESSGYEIHGGAVKAPFPIDLVAEIKCPVCEKPIRVAICCGGHSYRVDQELSEFNRASVTDFHAQLYVHPALPGLRKRCKEYGIELLDPLSPINRDSGASRDKIPILNAPVKGHQRAWRRVEDKGRTRTKP